MKIALLSEKYTPDIGGLAISTGRLGESLATIGHDVRVFAPSPSASLRADFSLPAANKQTLRSGKVLVTRFGAHKRMDDTLVDWFELIVEEHKREPFDLIHAYFLPMAGFVGAYAGKYLNIPSVVSIRGNDIERAAFDPLKFSHVMYALQNAGAVTTNASELAKKAKAFINREIHLIPNGIDTDRFTPLERNEVLAEMIGLESEKAKKERSTVVGFVGELREKKGLTTLLLGYAQVNKIRPTTLFIVGEIRPGDDRAVFDEFRSEHPNSKIIVTGPIPHNDLPAYYSLMDVFVHPSLRDGMPNALLEAMACEIPVIVTPVGGVLDVLEDGKNGLLVNVKDENSLAEKILGLLDNNEKRRALGKSARESILNRFTLQKELEANLNVYRTIGLKV
ncbi:MAG: glycosyltransferase family 4 protein [Anaerolineales bacterium]|nr:glycosyltransferase family 4 protein [Anaerolineales bacterium]